MSLPIEVLQMRNIQSDSDLNAVMNHYYLIKSMIKSIFYLNKLICLQQLEKKRSVLADTVLEPGD